MKSQINLLDVVALTEDLPERNLYRGQVGTVVEFLAESVFEVEFSDHDGCTYESLALKTEQLMVLHFAISDDTIENVTLNQTNPTIESFFSEVEMFKRNEKDSMSINISGSPVLGATIGSGTTKVSNSTLSPTNTTITQSSSEVDMKAELDAIKKILRNIESPEQTNIDNALTVINQELEEPEPDKDYIGKTMHRALKFAKEAANFVKYVEQLKPHVFNFLAWCGLPPIL